MKVEFSFDSAGRTALLRCYWPPRCVFGVYDSSMLAVVEGASQEKGALLQLRAAAPDEFEHTPQARVLSSASTRDEFVQHREVVLVAERICEARRPCREHRKSSVTGCDECGAGVGKVFHLLAPFVEHLVVTACPRLGERLPSIAIDALEAGGDRCGFAGREFSLSCAVAAVLEHSDAGLETARLIKHHRPPCGIALGLQFLAHCGKVAVVQRIGVASAQRFECAQGNLCFAHRREQAAGIAQCRVLTAINRLIYTVAQQAQRCPRFL